MDVSVTDPPEVPMESKKRSKNFLAAVRRISGVRLIQMVYLTVMLAFIGYVAYATFSQYLQMQSALLTIKSNITPSILRADKIRNEILSTDSKESVSYLSDFSQILANFESAKIPLNYEIVQAAGGVRHGDDEAQPLADLIGALSSYNEALVRVQAAGPSDGRQAFVKASSILQESAAPSAEQFRNVDSQELHDVYHNIFEGDNYKSAWSVFGWISLAIIVAVQLTLLGYGRRLSPAMLVATALIIAIIGANTFALGNLQRIVKNAVVDAFPAIGTLSAARTVLYGANADESLYLIGDDKGDLADHFFKKINHLFSADLRDAGVMAATKSAMRDGTPLNRQGYFADEANHHFYPGEEKAFEAVLDAFSEYLSVDKQIRQLESSQHQADAVALAVGRNPGQAIYAFERIEVALDDLIRADQSEFDTELDQSLAVLTNMTIVAASAYLLLVFLVILGTRSLRARDHVSTK